MNETVSLTENIRRAKLNNHEFEWDGAWEWACGLQAINAELAELNENLECLKGLERIASATALGTLCELDDLKG